MKILILTQWFEPEPTPKGLLFARELLTRGHEVEVLTGFPNYPGGKLYPGYRIRPWVREQIDGVRVLRVALYPSHSNSGFQRALNYISFALSAALIGTALINGPDVVYVYHPPITVGIAGAVIGFLRRAPFVYDIQDLWPDTVASTGMMSNPTALALLGKLCNFVYHRAAHITVLSRGFREQLVDRGIPADKIEVIYNWCDEMVLKHNRGPITRLGSGNRFSILFAGTMGHAQGLDSVLRAAQICRTTVPSAEFLFIGGGVDRGRLESMAETMELGNVKFLPRQPMHAMGGILAGADALLVHLKDDPLFRITIPSKTQAYLAAGKPILMAVHGDAADLVSQARAGVICEPGNPHSIAAAVKELVDTGNEQLAQMGRAGRAFYDSELSVSIGVDKFERIFSVVASNGVAACKTKPMYRGTKYTVDLAITLAGSIVVLPLSALIALLLWLTQGKVLFRQLRPGLHGKPFTLYKFCTMRDARGEDGNLLPDEQRITKIGAFVRNLSLDELPQFWNVIKGQMSLVGPRPLLMEYLPRYTPEEARRHDVTPGITGWAQVNGRNAISWESKFALDVWYVDHASFFLDLRILWMTCLRVIRRSGISNQGHATMPHFMGKNVEN